MQMPPWKQTHWDEMSLASCCRVSRFTAAGLMDMPSPRSIVGSSKPAQPLVSFPSFSSCTRCMLSSHALVLYKG